MNLSVTLLHLPQHFLLVYQIAYHNIRRTYGYSVKTNKTRTSKVGAISKAQKVQNNIFEKTNIHSVAKYQISKKLKGGPFGGKKFF